MVGLVHSLKNKKEVFMSKIYHAEIAEKMLLRNEELENFNYEMYFSIFLKEQGG